MRCLCTEFYPTQLLLRSNVIPIDHTLQQDETKVEKYEKAEALSLLLILEALSAEDVDIIDEHQIALTV